LRYIRPEENGGAEGMEITTMSLLMKPRFTRVGPELCFVFPRIGADVC
jgi:hypothetical protein